MSDNVIAGDSKEFSFKAPYANVKIDEMGQQVSSPSLIPYMV